MNRRQFLRPFVMLAGGLVSSCAGVSPTSPTTAVGVSTSNRLQPANEILASNGTRAILRYWDYASANESLLQAMRDVQLNPQPRRAGYGSGTFELPGGTYGWIFTVQTQLFGSDASNVWLNKGDLWAAYEKQSYEKQSIG